MQAKGTKTVPKKKTPKKRKPRAPLWKRILWSFLIALAFTSVATAAIIFYLTSSTFDPSKLLKMTSSPPTIVYDRYDHVAFTINSTGTRSVPLSKIPMNLRNALIATEDVRFYQDSGVDLRGILRSVWIDLTHSGGLQGASTITEQLGKIVYLTDDESLKYKLQEIILAVQINRYFTKDQILDMYFNTANFNGATPGIENAAQIYFHKDVNQLDLVQSALLAGLPQAPTDYDPFLHPQAALARRNIVLGQMAKYGYITQDQAAAAEAKPLELASSPGFIADGVPAEDASYRDYLYEEANSIGIGAGALQQGGYKVYTDLDPNIQQAAYDQFSNDRYFPPNMGNQEAQAGAAFVNPANGGLLAIMGSRPNAYQYLGFDYATQTERSPGSSIKPLVVYGPAIETGQYDANSLLYDGPLSLDGYQPHDWEWHPTINDQVTMREALAESWNIPAVWLLDQIGISTGLNFAERTGLNFAPRDFEHIDVALGDIHPGTNPLQMADAYSAFDNNGERYPSHAIERIVNANGETVYQTSPAPVVVMKTSTARAMLTLLRNNVVNGIAGLAGVPYHDVAGKTGSVAYQPPGYSYSPGDSDLWFSGFTTNVVGSIWEGFPNPGPNAYVPNWVGGSALPAELFSAIMREGLANEPPTHFAETVYSTSQTPTIGSLAGLTGLYQAGQNGVVLNWHPYDGTNVYYLVFRGGAHAKNLVYTRAIARVFSSSYVDPLSVPGTYTYEVAAFNTTTHKEVAQSGITTVGIT